MVAVGGAAKPTVAEMPQLERPRRRSQIRYHLLGRQTKTDAIHGSAERPTDTLFPHFVLDFLAQDGCESKSAWLEHLNICSDAWVPSASKSLLGELGLITLARPLSAVQKNDSKR